MNRSGWVKPTRGVLVVLYLCVSSFILHLGGFTFTCPTNSDANLLVIYSPGTDTTDLHPDDDAKNPGELILEAEVNKDAHEWATFLPTQTVYSERLTPPPKSN
jgi:hypothetical protein